MTTISEREFQRLCDDIYADREQVYTFNPQVSHGEALQWMLLGCLISLLSVPVQDQPNPLDYNGPDPYADAICALLRHRMEPEFDPRRYLDEWSEKLTAES